MADLDEALERLRRAGMAVVDSGPYGSFALHAVGRDVSLIRAAIANRNVRHGFVHIHSGEIECGMAYPVNDFHDGPTTWRPCSKKMNHEDACGYGDLSAL